MLRSTITFRRIVTSLTAAPTCSHTLPHSPSGAADGWADTGVRLGKRRLGRILTAPPLLHDKILIFNDNIVRRCGLFPTLQTRGCLAIWR